MKYNVKRLYSCIFHLILVAILYCLLRTGGSEFLLKHDESYLPIVPKTSMGSTLFLYYLLFTYFYLSSLNISNPLCQHALKMCKLKDQQSTFEFFSIICVLISPLPLLPASLRDRDFKILSNFLTI